MAKQDVLHLQPGNLVTGGNDQVVGPGVIPEIAVLIHAEGVAGQVPAALHVILLARVVQIDAAGRAAHRQPPELARRQRVQVVVHHPGLVARNHLARGAGPDGAGRGMQDGVQHLRRAEAVQDLHPRHGLPAFQRGGRQRLPRRDAGAQRAQPLGQGRFLLDPHGHGAIDGRHGEHHRRLVLGCHLHQPFRRCPVQKHHRRPDPQGEQQHPPLPVGEGKGGRAAEHVVAAGLQHRLRRQVGHRQKVAMEMRGRLGLARGAGGEGDQRHVVRGGVHRGESGLSFLKARLQIPAVEGHDGHPPAHRRRRRGDVLDVARVAQGQRDGRALDDAFQFRRAQQRHGRHHHSPGLQHRQPTGRQHRRVGSAHQDPVARHDSELPGQDPRDPVHRVAEAAIAPHVVVPDDAGPLVPAALPPAVQQGRGGVQPLRVGQFGAAVEKVGHPLRRRQTVAGEAVDMTGPNHPLTPPPRTVILSFPNRPIS